MSVTISKYFPSASEFEVNTTAGSNSQECWIAFCGPETTIEVRVPAKEFPAFVKNLTDMMKTLLEAIERKNHEN